MEFATLDPQEAKIPQTQRYVVTDRGVATVEFPLPPASPGGPYTLVARSPSGQYRETRLPFRSGESGVLEDLHLARRGDLPVTTLLPATK